MTTASEKDKLEFLHQLGFSSHPFADYSILNVFVTLRVTGHDLAACEDIEVVKELLIGRMKNAIRGLQDALESDIEKVRRGEKLTRDWIPPEGDDEEVSE